MKENCNEKVGNKPKKIVRKREIPVEQKVLIFSTQNKSLNNQIIKLAEKKDIEVVQLEDKVITDYLKTKTCNKEDKLNDFLNDSSNRINAEEQCLKLWTILTGGESIEDSEARIFSKKEIVEKTNLSNKKASELLSLFEVFNLIEFVRGSHEFHLVFDDKKKSNAIKKGIFSLVKAINFDFIRYKNSILNNKKLTENEKNKKIEKLKKELIDMIKQ